MQQRPPRRDDSLPTTTTDLIIPRIGLADTKAVDAPVANIEAAMAKGVELTTAPVMVKGKHAVVKLSGVLTTDGVSVYTDDHGKEKHSIGLDLHNEQDVIALANLVQRGQAILPIGDGEEFLARSPFKNGVLYLKLKQEGEGYRFIKNITFDNAAETLSRGSDIVVDAKVSWYYQVKGPKAYGLFFTPMALEVTRKDPDADEIVAAAPVERKSRGSRRG